jgi:hypothetical protein
MQGSGKADECVVHVLEVMGFGIDTVDDLGERGADGFGWRDMVPLPLFSPVGLLLSDPARP